MRITPLALCFLESYSKQESHWSPPLQSARHFDTSYTRTPCVHHSVTDARLAEDSNCLPLAHSLLLGTSVTCPGFPTQEVAAEAVLPVLLSNAQLCHCSLRLHGEGDSHLLNLSAGNFTCLISSDPLSHTTNTTLFL